MRIACVICEEMDKKMKRIYLDYAATTPVKQEVLQAMMPFFVDVTYDNKQLETITRTFESYIGAEPGTVTFNHGGSYGSNAAIKGLAQLSRERGKRIITSKIEHPAVYKVFELLGQEGFDVVYVDVDDRGMIDLAHLTRLIDPNTAFVSIMWINNEIGTIQPIDKVAELCKGNGVYLHVDAVQALGNLNIDVNKLGVDVMTFSSHKVYAPKGCGAMYVKRGLDLNPLIKGCNDVASVNLPYIAGFVKGVELSYEHFDQMASNKRKLKKRLIDGLVGLDIGIKPIANVDDQKQHPGIVSFYFPQMDSDSLIINFDFNGIAISGGSACSSGALSASHVLRAIGMSEADAKKCVRMTVGDLTTEEEIDRVVETAKRILKG